MRAARLTVWLKMLVLLVPVLPLSAGEEPLQPTRAAEIQAHIERLQNNADINPQFRSRLLKILPKIAEGAPANVILPGCRGNTALHYACAMGDFFMAIWLLEHGATPTRRNNSGQTPMDCLQGSNASFIRTHLREVL